MRRWRPYRRGDGPKLFVNCWRSQRKRGITRRRAFASARRAWSFYRLRRYAPCRIVGC